MAEIVAGLLGPVIEVAKSVAEPITSQFNYLWCFTNNITSLKNEANILKDTRRGLKRKVDRAEDDVQVISSEVKSWLKNSNDIINETKGIMKEVPNVESGWSKLSGRYSLSKRAKYTTYRLKELQGQCNFDNDAIAQPRPPAAREAIPFGTTYEFESRKQIEEDIMTTLKLGFVNTMGICGMGGLGKTTMAKRIMNRALVEGVFDEVVMAVISQTVDKLKIQVEIGGTLGLKLEGETYQSRVQKLYTRLSGTKRILLVLDDVWERLDLGDLGIPCYHKECTILLTSRNRNTLSAMNVEKVFGMDVLSKEDARFLFRKRAGSCVDNTNLNLVAKEVVDECQGLPIALITVGDMLREEMDASIWTDALSQLRKSDPDIPELIKFVYNPLRLSYNDLGPKHKSVFLLCCLYPEDANIPLEHLTYFCMGLGVFEGCMEEARNKMRALTKILKSRSLLLDIDDSEDYVRMHDVIRDVGIFIAKKERYVGGNDCSWISSCQRIKISSRLGLTNLRLMLWICDSVNAEFKVDRSFFEGIRDLHVLYIERDSLTSLPFTTQSMKNLKTLVILKCKKLENLSSIGELVSLEILVCCECYWIEELPREMEGLTRLKVLDLTWCISLERIGRGLISNLVGLEELKMLGSFKKWEAWDREVRGNARLKELEALTKLRCLEIEIEDPALVVENMQLSSKLDRFDIRLSCFHQNFDLLRFSKKLHLRLEGESCLGRWIEMQLLRQTECLYLERDGANNVELAKFENIRVLELGDCASMKKMVRASSNNGVLPYMEHICLFNVPKLKKIWDAPIWLNLKELDLKDLPSLNQLWKTSGVDFEKDYLPQLETLRIARCTKMVQVFKWDKNENGSHNIHHITKRFPKLKNVNLYYLPNLTSFYNGIQSIEFPQLSELCIEGCGKLNWMVSEGNGNNSGVRGGRNSNTHIHQPQEVSLSCLKALTTDWNPCGGHKIHISVYNGLEELLIWNYSGSMSLFSTSITIALVNLKKLNICQCDEMVKVISNEEEVVRGGERVPLFPKLQELQLKWLHKLVSFCKWKCNIELPLLSKVEITDCPSMQNFSLGPLITPKLTIVMIDVEDLGATKDLNDVLRQRWLH